LRPVGRGLSALSEPVTGSASLAQTKQRFLARLPKPGTTSLTDVPLEEEGHFGQREKGPKEQRACFGAAN
jgi:hypothetical protein